MADFLKNSKDDVGSEDDMQHDEDDNSSTCEEDEEEEDDDEDYTYESDDDMSGMPPMDRADSVEGTFIIPEGSCVFVNYKGKGVSLLVIKDTIVACLWN